MSIVCPICLTRMSCIDSRSGDDICIRKYKCACGNKLVTKEVVLTIDESVKLANTSKWCHVTKRMQICWSEVKKGLNI